MARGKEALATANRRLEAAHSHIDRLASDLADARIRARDAEKRAARLEGIESLLGTANPKSDRLLQESLSALHRQVLLHKERRRRIIAALGEINERLWQDLKLPDVPAFDKVELLCTRYPRLMELMVERSDRTDIRRRNRSTDRKFSGDELRRFQVAMGDRSEVEGFEGVPVADALNDLMDGRAIGLTFDEIKATMPG